MNHNDLFWTAPSDPESSPPADPLGLDAMRDELAGHLVPCLTSRTVSHEDFYWTLVFIKWAAQEPTHEKRVASFLSHERCLKLLWANEGRQGFSGSRRAREQEQEPGAPSLAYRKLLKLPQSQGLLGAHLAPLRSLGLAEKGVLDLTEAGRSLVETIDPAPPKLRDKSWESWRNAFGKVDKHFTKTAFCRRLRDVLAAKMKDLDEALNHIGYPTPDQQQWARAAKHMPENLARHAVLAGHFCPWAVRVRDFFTALITNKGKVGKERCPLQLRVHIPQGLDDRWHPLREALKNWNTKAPERFLAEWHRKVFEARKYGPNDVWLHDKDGKITWFPRRITPSENAGGDCRWRNAIGLMKRKQPWRGSND